MRTEATTPEFTAADAVAMAMAHEETPEATTPEEETEQTDTEATAEEVPAEEVSEDLEDDDTDLDLPKLNQKALDAIGDNAEAQEAWNEAWKGVIKRETRFKEKEEHYNGLDRLQQAFDNPTEVNTALEHVLKYVNETHGLNLTLTKAAPTTETQTDTEGDEWFVPTDKVVYERAVQEAKRQVMAELGVDPRTIQDIAKREQQAREQEAHEQRVTKLAPTVIARAEKTEGWKVTKDMVSKAMLDPTFEQNQVAALKRAFPDEWASHKVKQAGEKKKMPEMLSGQSAKGFTLPKDGEEMTAEMAVALALAQ